MQGRDQDIIKNSEKCAEWLTQGTAVQDSQNAKPKYYRRISCLPTMCKIVTSIIAERNYNLDKNSLLPARQKGCRGGSYGHKDHILMTKVIIEEVKSKKRIC